MIFNISEVDFPENWSTSVNEIAQRLKSTDESHLISGLLALRQIFEAQEYHLDKDRGALNQLVDIFFPLLENIMGGIAASQSPNQLLLMTQISKIFYSANNVLFSDLTCAIVNCGSLFYAKPDPHLPLDELLPVSSGDLTR